MLDVIARLLISISIMVGTTQLPSLSAAVTTQTVRTDDVPAKPGRFCPAKRDTFVRACMV